MISEEAQHQIARGFEQEPEPPERVLANFEALPDDDRLWVYEMIHEWMEQTDPTPNSGRQKTAKNS